MEKTAKTLGLNVVKRYREAQSASKLGRPRFAEMMQDVMNVSFLGSNFQILNKKLTLDMEPVWKLFSTHSQQLFKDLTPIEVDETGMIKEKTLLHSL